MKERKKEARPARWVEEETALHADCRVFQVRRRRFRHPDRSEGDDFYVVESPDWAMAMAQTSDGRWILVRQFRFGLGDFTWEFPSGCLEPGEDPEAGARRELEEETGFVADPPVPLGVVRPNPAIMNNTCHFFYFPNARPAGRTSWDEHEEIEVTTLPMPDVTAWAARGKITHSLVHTGLFLFSAWRDGPGRR